MKRTSRALLAALIALGAACAHEVRKIDDSDPAIKARVEAALRSSKDIDAKFITIDVHDRVVTISGIVAAHEQIRLVYRLAKRAHGVETVMTNLLVQE